MRSAWSGRSLVTLALVCGIVIGVVLPTLTWVPEYHTVCHRGPLVGWSGTLLVVDGLYVPPPGGWVAESDWAQETFSENGTTWTIGNGGSGIGNSSYADLDVANFTLYDQSAQTVAGPGPVVQCSSVALTNQGKVGWAPFGGCAGCPVAGPVPGNIGTRVDVPWQFADGNVSSVIFDGNYSSSPIGSFNWSENTQGCPVWNVPSSLTDLGISFGSYYNPTIGVEGLGLSYSIPYDETGFGVPVHYTDGRHVIGPPSLRVLSSEVSPPH